MVPGDSPTPRSGRGDLCAGCVPMTFVPGAPLFRGVTGAAHSTPALVQRTMEVGADCSSACPPAPPPTATPNHALNLRHSFATHLLGAGGRPAGDPGTSGPCLAVDETQA